ncbi:MAG: hypothetical protein Q9162_007321 [Coniocarpon cinnabarinum]
MAYQSQGPQDSRNSNNRPHLTFTNNERGFSPDSGRQYPTTPSAFPQPVYPSQNGQPEVWGSQQPPPTQYQGGPPSYFVQHVNLQQPTYQQSQQALAPGSSGYKGPPSSHNDGTNGLVHQFSHQNLGAVTTSRSASPYGRTGTPTGSRPRTPGNTQNSQAPHATHVASGLGQGISALQDDELPPKNADKYADNIYRRAKHSTEQVGNFFRDNVQRAKERNQRGKDLEQSLSAPGMDERKKAQKKNELRRGEARFLRFLRTKERPENFSTLKVIGKGAFGEVKLVTRKSDNKIYALKSLVKSEMYKRDQLAHVRSERDVLAESDSPWVVKLHTTFQDKVFLYMLMEFLPGGDLMTMLIKYEIFSEDITRFYMAELVLAIEAVHQLGFIHRDIKPDNILLDRGGHIKLTDFGLSTGFHKQHDQSYYQQLINGKAPKSSHRENRNSMSIDQIQLTVSNRNQINTWRKSRRQLAYSTVGTPDYIAPEIFTGKGYDFACDWWSVGTIMFECLIGWPPFCAEESTDTYRKIVDWPRHLHFPPDQKLITDADKRLGTLGGGTEIKQHPFFRGVVWDDLRRIRAPFEPKLTSAVDTQYFPVDEIPQQDTDAVIRARDEAAAAAAGDEGAAEMDYPFAGYTYKRFNAFQSS